MKAKQRYPKKKITTIAPARLHFGFLNWNQSIDSSIGSCGMTLNNFVTKIKKEYPHIKFILNGGINSVDKAFSLSKIHDGVMVGRLIQNNPFPSSYLGHLSAQPLESFATIFLDLFFALYHNYPE